MLTAEMFAKSIYRLWLAVDTVPESKEKVACFQVQKTDFMQKTPTIILGILTIANHCLTSLNSFILQKFYLIHRFILSEMI